MLPNAQDLQYFLEITRTLNISRAAERLGVTQPTLSLSLKRLEEAVGVALLLRSKSGVQVTQSGKKLALQASELLQQWQLIRKQAQENQNEVHGHFKLGAHASVALYSLGEFLPKLLKKNPYLEISLVHDLSRKITEQVVSYEIDFGVVVNPVTHPDLVLTQLCEDEVGFYASLNCINHDVLISDPDLIQTQALQNQLKKKNIVFKRFLHSSSLEVVADLVSKGAGVGILPGRVASRFGLGAKQFKVDYPKFKDQVYLVYRADAQKNAAAREIARAIKLSF